jgi:crotonobetainyl-CoA:carnitine CoA-transferase CaiB-like acyl-CoA transferase
MQVAIGEKATGPLAGIRVVDLSTIVSGPLCGQILGDLGADVVKIETPIGDSTRYLGERKGDFAGSFAQVNRNKRSVVLDLKREAAADALRRLVADADVLVENFRPGVMERLGLGYERLREDNPRLVYAAINGFGPDGPYADQPAYDMVIQALSSVAKMIGTDEEPKLVSNLLADKTAGLNGAFAIAAALYERERTGVGQRIDIPMLDAFASFLLSDTLGAHAFGPPPASGAFGELLFRAWKTADGHVAIVIIEDHQWAAFCKVIEREDAADDERFSSMGGRVLNAAELITFMEKEIEPRELPRRPSGEEQRHRLRAGPPPRRSDPPAAQRAALLPHPVERPPPRTEPRCAHRRGAARGRAHRRGDRGDCRWEVVTSPEAN